MTNYKSLDLNAFILSLITINIFPSIIAENLLDTDLHQCRLFLF